MKNIFWLTLVISFLMVACTDKEFEETVVPRDGEEVNFSVNVNDGKSRTLYGNEATDDKSIQVNWVKGDKVMVYGTDCSNSSAEYKVPDGANGKNYAGILEKTGAAGVQWGTATSSDFYSVYPSNSTIEPNTIDENKKTTSVKVMTEIRQTQNVSFAEISKGVWVGQHFNGDASNPTMTDAVMYAVTSNVTAGDVVNLKYKPFSNAFRFTFNGFNIKLGSDELTGSVENTVYVRNIKITAPFAISGKFPMIIDNEGNVEVDATGFQEELDKEDGGTVSNTVVITPDYLPLSTGETVQFDVFTIPASYNLSSEEYFVVTIETSNFGSFTYYMKPTKQDGIVNHVKAGQMHKVTIPVKTVEKVVSIPMDSWMRYIPRNVYLSELSMPGAWYCMDSNYQGSIGLESDDDSDGIDDGLEALYAAGVRAFNIDCRVSRSAFRDMAILSNPWTDTNYENKEYHFACAGTENPGTLLSYVSMEEGVHVLKAVKDIVKLANANPYELVTIIFTYAEKPCTESGGTNKIYGTTNPEYITAELKTVLEDENIAPYIYKNVDSNTTIGDLLTTKEDGAQYPKNVLVKINHSNNQFYTEYASTMPVGIMASYGSMALESEGWGNSYLTSISTLPTDYYSVMQHYPIYNGISKNDMTYYYCQAQKTYADGSTNTPTVAQRKSAIDDVLTKATEVYVKSTHNALFQLGIGGSLNDNQLSIAEQLNPYVQTAIETKLSSSSNLSPLGFVLMNYCLDNTYGIPLINDIFKFNTKFYLNRNEDDEEWPEDCGGNAFEELYGTEW